MLPDRSHFAASSSESLRRRRAGPTTKINRACHVGLIAKPQNARFDMSAPAAQPGGTRWRQERIRTARIAEQFTSKRNLLRELDNLEQALFSVPGTRLLLPSIYLFS